MGSLTLTLKGPGIYYLVIEKEGNKRIEILAGEYTYTATGCGTIKTGVLDFSGKRKTWMFSRSDQ